MAISHYRGTGLYFITSYSSIMGGNYSYPCVMDDYGNLIPQDNNKNWLFTFNEMAEFTFADSGK